MKRGEAAGMVEGGKKCRPCSMTRHLSCEIVGCGCAFCIDHKTLWDKSFLEKLAKDGGEVQRLRSAATYRLAVLNGEVVFLDATRN